MHPSDEITTADAKVILVIKRELAEALAPVTAKLDQIGQQLHADALAHKDLDYRIKALEVNRGQAATDKIKKGGMISETVVLRIITIIAALAALAMGAKNVMEP